MRGSERLPPPSSVHLSSLTFVYFCTEDSLPVGSLISSPASFVFTVFPLSFIKCSCFQPLSLSFNFALVSWCFTVVVYDRI